MNTNLIASRAVIARFQTGAWRTVKRHRDGGLPASVWASGTQEWWLNGLLHRDGDLPAYIRSDGTQEWRVNGVRQRV